MATYSLATLIAIFISSFYYGQSQVILDNGLLKSLVPAYTTATSIDLSSKSIIYIDSLTFKYTPQVFTTLSLSRNQLSAITATVFINSVTLKTLTLSYNKITKIETNAFNNANLNSLTTLDLSYNNFTSLTYNDIFGLTNLSVLRLEYNQLTDISNLFRGSSSYYTKLTHIYLTGNLITTISTSTFNLIPSLVYLYLNDNKLVTIAAQSFYGLTNLQFIFIGNNPITNSYPLNVQQLCLANPRCTVCFYSTCSKDNKLVL
jgi:Leucine-rich repeat (LRR) protein